MYSGRASSRVSAYCKQPDRVRKPHVKLVRYRHSAGGIVVLLLLPLRRRRRLSIRRGPRRIISSLTICLLLPPCLFCFLVFLLIAGLLLEAATWLAGWLASWLVCSQKIMDEYLSDEVLAELTGRPDFAQTDRLEMVVDTHENTLACLGIKLPRLRELRLSGSTLASLRDLGTCLKSLAVLFIRNCHLPDLDGIAGLPSLRELYAPFNPIEDLSPLVMLEHLEILDVEGCSICDVDSLSFLSHLRGTLHTLTVVGNPMVAAVGADVIARKIKEYCPFVHCVEIAQSQDELSMDLDKELSLVRMNIIGAPPASALPSGTPIAHHSFSSSSLSLSSSSAAAAAVGMESRVVWKGAPPGSSSRPGQRQRPLSARPMSVRQAAAVAAASFSTSRPNGLSHRNCVDSLDLNLQGGHHGQAQSSASAPRSRHADPFHRSYHQGQQLTARAHIGADSGHGSGRAGLGFAQAVQDHQDESSNLTFGTSEVFCGNPVKRLRNRMLEIGAISNNNHNSNNSPRSGDGSSSGSTPSPGGSPIPSPSSLSSSSCALLAAERKDDMSMKISSYSPVIRRSSSLIASGSAGSDTLQSHIDGNAWIAGGAVAAGRKYIPSNSDMNFEGRSAGAAPPVLAPPPMPMPGLSRSMGAPVVVGRLRPSSSRLVRMVGVQVVDDGRRSGMRGTGSSADDENSLSDATISKSFA